MMHCMEDSPSGPPSSPTLTTQVTMKGDSSRGAGIRPAGAGREQGNGRTEEAKTRRDEWEQPLSWSQAGRPCRKGGVGGGAGRAHDN